MDQTTAQSQSSSKPIFRNPIFYVGILIVLGAILTFALIYQNPKTSIQGADYETGLEKSLIRIGLLGEFYRYPDAQSISSQPASIMNANVFEGLVVWKNGKYVPSLALSWTNPDELTWRFTLRQNVKFQTGETFTAKDVKYTIDSALADENFGSNYNATSVDSVNVVDDYTVELKTAEPNPQLLDDVSYLYILSKEQVERDGLENAVGTGAYKVTSLKPEVAVLEANQDYWGGAPKIKVAMYKYRATRDELADDFKKGDIDLFYAASSKTTSEFKALGAQIVTRNAQEVSMLGFDLESDTTKNVEGTNGKNPFQDSKVRHAIWDALDITKVYGANNLTGIVLSQLSTPELVGYNPSIPAHKQNVASAKSLLTEAGYPNGFSFTLLVPTTGELYAKEIATQLAQVGITMKLDLVDFDTYLDKLGYGADPSLKDFSAFYLTQGTGVTSLGLLGEIVKSDGGTNIGLYANKEIDDMIADAKSEFDPAKASEKVKNIHVKVNEELPYIPLYSNVLNFITRDDFALPTDLFTEPLFAKEISGRQKVTESN